MNVSKEYTQLPWSATHLSILAGPTELATLLGLSRPSVVTNWRGRYPDFPSPRSGSAGSPQYDVVEVMAWLRLSGSRVREVPVIAGERWWEAVVSAFQVQSGVPSPRSTMVSLVLLHCVLHRELGSEGAEHWASAATAPSGVPTDASDDPRRMVEALLRAARWAERRLPAMDGLLVGPLRVPSQDAGSLHDVVRALQWYVEHPPEASAAIAADSSASGPWVGLLAAVLGSGLDGRPTPSRVTGRALSAVIAALADLPDDAVVLDPAAGEGALLLAASRRCRGGRLHGQELDADTWRIARSVLAVHQVPADLDGAGHNSITDDRFADLRADAVLIDPPVGGAAPQLDLWVEHGLRHLAPAGRVVVALPMSELVEVRASRRTANTRLVGYVQQLALDGRIESVLAVPRGTRRDVVGPLALMVVVARGVDRTAINVGVASELPGASADRTTSDRDLDLEADGMVARLRGAAVQRPGADLVLPDRVEPSGLFRFLESATSTLESRVMKGPRSGVNVRASASSRMMSAPPPSPERWAATVDAITVSSARRPRPGADIVDLALLLVDRLERDRHSLDPKQAHAVLFAAQAAQRLVEPLTEP